MKKNSMRITFCPGPGAVIPEWSEGQTEFFGRGDNYYSSVKKKVLTWIKKISKQDNVIPIAGSGTTAAILAFNTFLKGNVCIIIQKQIDLDNVQNQFSKIYLIILNQRKSTENIFYYFSFLKIYIFCRKFIHN